MEDIRVEIAAYLVGTCHTVGMAAHEFKVSIETVEEAVVDQEIFLCDDCFWWYEVGQKSDTEYANETGGDICEDCGDYDGGSD